MRPRTWSRLLALALLGLVLTACGQGVGVAMPTAEPAQPTALPQRPTAPPAQPNAPTARPAQPTALPQRPAAGPIAWPVDQTPAAEPGSIDAEAIGRMIREHMGALRPGQPVLAAAVATAGDYALGIARPQGEQMDTFFYLKRERGVWRQLLVSGPTTTDVLVNNGIPVSLEVPQPMFGIMMGTFGHFNGGPGGAADGHAVINSIADGHARVTLRDAAQGEITVYLRQDGVWAALIAGQVFAPEALDELGVPPSVRQ